MKIKKILVLGAKGMLGQELVKAFSSDGHYTVVGWDMEDIDVTDFEQAQVKIRELNPNTIINAIAYNAVDRCEESDDEYKKALMLNAEVPKFLAVLSKELGAIFVHYSTDYVFDGENALGYREDAVPHPISKYGESKWLGEKNVLATEGRNYLIRLSKLFGKPATSMIGKKSFFQVMLEKAETTTEPLKVVDDERSCFTYAPDLALATKVLAQEEKPYGIYHIANEKAATWYEATKELFRIVGKKVVVEPVSGSAFPRPAKRPHTSELLNTKFTPLRPYTEALEEFLTLQK